MVLVVYDNRLEVLKCNFKLNMVWFNIGLKTFDRLLLCQLKVKLEKINSIGLLNE